MLRRLAATCLVASFCILELSCFSSDGGGNSGSGGVICSRYEGRLRSCGLLSPGHFRCGEPDDAQERCEANCALAASCEDIELFTCDAFGSVAGGSPSSSLTSCLFECESAEFDCDNGDSVPERWVCDGEDDCGDNSDERGCSSMPDDDFECGDGELIPRGWVCDGGGDCADGSDERDCPTFECPDGEEIPLSYLCDDDPDCSDNADEDDCAEVLCNGNADASSSSTNDVSDAPAP